MEKIFDYTRAGRFKAKGLKIAVLTAEPAVYGKPSWVDREKNPKDVLAFQPFGGPHMTVSIPKFDDGGPTGEWDTYGSDIEQFRQTHTLVHRFPGFPESALAGSWIKDTDEGIFVEAYELTADDAGGATVLEGAATAETSDYQAPPGHWRVRQPGGEVQDIAPAQFAYLYEPAD